MKKIITILLLCVLASHISETFLKKTCYIELSQEQENEEEKCMKKVEKKEIKEFFCNSTLLQNIQKKQTSDFSLTIIQDVSAPLIEHIVPPPNV